MWRDIYIAEKLRDLAAERGGPAPRPTSPASRPKLRLFVGLTGRTLRGLGEGLESWAAAAHPERQREQRRYQGG